MTVQWLARIATMLEQADHLDGIAAGLQRRIARAVPEGAARRIAQGEPIGHPAHPFVVLIPIGAWIGASVLDATAAARGRQPDRDAARRLIGTGVLAALPAAYAGAAEWLETEGPARRVGMVHAATNSVALSLYAASWLARRRGNHRAGILLSVVGGCAVSAGGWLGGHLSYVLAVGQRPDGAGG